MLMSTLCSTDVLFYFSFDKVMFYFMCYQFNVMLLTI
jgi:hypothetical protein